MKPVICESRRLLKVLDGPQKKAIKFICYLKGKKLILKSSRITSQKRLHSNRLVNLFLTELLVRGMSNSIGINIDLDHKVDQLSSDFNTSVSVDSSSCNLHLQELTLDITSKNYSLPDFNNQMGQLKVLCLTSQSDSPSKLHNLTSVARLTNLTTIRFEHVLIPSLQPVFALKNLKQLSFIMCEIRDAFMSFTTESPHTMPNLTRLEIDMCHDLKQLPSGTCNLVHLKKLSISNCNELDVLLKRLGDLSNLESLNLHCCTKLQELPESIGSLHNLSSIDISDCLSISVLPEEIGELCNLRVIKMNGCTGLQELPMSMSKLGQLEEVICDEETSYLWMYFESELCNLKINVVEDDRLESFMKIVE